MELLLLVALTFLGVFSLDTRTYEYVLDHLNIANHEAAEVSVSDHLIGFAFFEINDIVYYKKIDFLAKNISNPLKLSLSNYQTIKEHYSNSKYILTVYKTPALDF
jgi:hypothetical protein